MEQDCRGRGSDVSKRVKWASHNLTEAQMQPFSRARFIQDDWLATQPGGGDV